MKKLLFLISVIFIIVGCEKFDDSKPQALSQMNSKNSSITLSTETNQYQIVPDADVGAWILNTKTGETQHCWTNSYGQTPLCVTAEHREEVKRK